jgi:hypothetical protein
MTCATCGGSLVASARFCSLCGSAVPVRVVPAVDPLRALLESALGTHYEITRELGRGGMGAVFLAHEKGLDRDVAIKVLPPDRASSEVNRDRFRLEARAAARLSHANIVPLHTFGDHDGMLYYVMGYVEGESLADRLQREGHVDEFEARQILASLADALEYAHAHGVLHRDVKPQNILLEKGSNRPLLTDFGISKVSTEPASHTSTGMILGTPEYMSPEQASGDPNIDGRTDQYSLGLVAYAMLSGALPFQGRTPGELISKRIVEDAPRLVPVQPGVAADLVDAVMKCLSRDPRRRWADCKALAQVLAFAEDAAPEPFDSVGVLAAAFLYGGAVTFTIWRLDGDPSVTVEMLGKIVPTLAGFLIAISLVAAAQLWRRGYSVRQVGQTIFREPQAWALWYPASLRRSGNIWHRLPIEVRKLRVKVTVAAVGMLLAAAPMAFNVLTQPRRGLRETLALLIGLVFVATSVPAFLGCWFVPRRLQRQGLSFHDAAGIAYQVPPSRRGFWLRPTVAQFLTAQASGRTSGATASAMAVTRTSVTGTRPPTP